MTLRLVAWEATGACNLCCVHCRAAAKTVPDPGELETAEVLALVHDLAALARAAAGSGPLIFIISGGEPLMRPDIYEIARESSASGLHTVLATNGTLLDAAVVRQLKQAGVRRLSVSLDGPGPASHDEFRGIPGAFERAVRGLAQARCQGLPYQINTTVTRRNANHLPEMVARVAELGAVTWDVFMLVPTGRGVAETGLSGPEYERVLGWLAEASEGAPVEIKVTCGPHYSRIWRQRAARHVDPPAWRPAGHPSGHPAGPSAGRPARPPNGCMAGEGFVFVSRTGEVFPCGFLPVGVGNIRERPLGEIYTSSAVLAALRDPARLGGKCGRCEFGGVCRGCRARAFSLAKDYLAEEPLCLWKPRAVPSGDGLGAAAGVDRG